MSRLPVLFISHGAPTFALAPGLLGPQLTALGASLPPVEAMLVVSPHWMTPGLSVATGTQPRTVHDFGGFDRALYELDYPAPGNPGKALEAIEALRAAGWPAEPDAAQGLDHGAWVPLRYLYPAADVPVFQLSMPRRLDAATAYALGQALAPLRDAGVLVVGSGSLTHNLYEFRGASIGEAAYAKEFATWVRDAVQQDNHDRLLQTLSIAPHAERAHPTVEHFLPLLVAAGAAGAGAPVEVLDGGITHGVLSMDSYVFGKTADQGARSH